MSDYVELHCHSAFSLLDATSTPEALVARAVEIGMPALALTDHNALYGAVPLVEAAQSCGLHPIFGAEITLDTGQHLTLLVENAAGWRNLCQLITQAQFNAPKGQAKLPFAALADHAAGLICLSGCRRGPVAAALLNWDRRGAFQAARTLRDLFGPERFWIELQHHHRPDDPALIDSLISLAGHLQVGYVVTNNVHFARRTDQRLQDVLVAIRERLTLDAADPELRPNDECYLKDATRLRPLFRHYPGALTNTLRIAERCTFQLHYGLQDLPIFPAPDRLTAVAYLCQLCSAALVRHYPDPPDRVCAQMQYELEIIAQAGLANYFLIVWDVVRYARTRGIRCQGRGSAANSFVAYLLGITPIDPIRLNLVFERFLSAERAVMPDIDLDVDALRRDEVIAYLYSRYGTDHVALACTFITFQARSALNDVAKVLGLAPNIIRQAEALIDGDEAAADTEAALALILDLCRQIHGLPRHLGQHSGGMVLTGPPIAERLPIEPTAMPGRSVTQWDKDALEAAGLVKVDVLGLRALSAITEALELIKAMGGTAPDLDRLSYDDQSIYQMVTAGDTVGIFQLESRAQTSVLPRLKPVCFNDLAIAVSLIRPGPLQGAMVHPYLRRRAGREPVTYLHPLLEPVLKDTLGVLLFQEQVLQVVQSLAGWPAGQGEILRRALAKGDEHAISHLRQAFLDGAASCRVAPATAASVFKQLQSFAGYSFPRSHAAAFAVIVWQSAWLKRYAPVPFCVSLLNTQPVGFWPPSVVVNDAKRHGVHFLPVDAHRSAERCTIEEGAIRIGLSYVSGLGTAGIARLLAARAERPFAHLADLCRRTLLPRTIVERLILAGALDSWGVTRQQLLWDLGTFSYRADELDLDVPAPIANLPPVTHWEARALEESILGLSVGEHVMAMLRGWLNTQGMLSSKALRTRSSGERVEIAGKIVCHQAPPTAKNHEFLTIEDEHGLVDIIVRPSIAAQYIHIMRTASILIIMGMAQHEGGIPSVVAWKIEPLDNKRIRHPPL
jgi:error-prone DNA polymerase